MADKRVKYIADDGPFCEVGITGKQTSWRRNQSGFVTEANAQLLIASGKFVLSSTDFGADQDGLDSHLSQHSDICVPLSLGLVPSIMPSLVTSTTASQSGNVVTVSATAHGIPATVFDGWRVWYPGSASIPAGWYLDFSRTSADAFTFSNPTSQTVASESVNAGAFVSAFVEVCRGTIPGGLLGKNGRGEARLILHGGTTAAVKYARLNIGSSLISHGSGTSVASGVHSFSFSNLGNESKQRGFQSRDGTQLGSASVYLTNVDLSVDQPVYITVSANAAGDYVAVQNALFFGYNQP